MYYWSKRLELFNWKQECKDYGDWQKLEVTEDYTHESRLLDITDIDCRLLDSEDMKNKFLLFSATQTVVICYCHLIK